MTTTKTELEVFGQEINAPVIRMPSRKYPGVLVQGDSLHNLLSLVRGAEAALAAGNSEEASDSLEEARGLIEGYEAVFRKALTENGLTLPY